MSLAVGQRGLVAVVTVGDQQLAVGERLGDAFGREPPETGALDLEVGLSLGPARGRRALVEEEQRLELGLDLAQQAQAALLRATVRAFVGEDDAVLVRLGLERGDEALARARDAVGADVVLREPPEAGLVLVRSVPSSRQARHVRPASASSAGNVRWTTLCSFRAASCRALRAR